MNLHRYRQSADTNVRTILEYTVNRKRVNKKVFTKIIDRRPLNEVNNHIHRDHNEPLIEVR